MTQVVYRRKVLFGCGSVGIRVYHDGKAWHQAVGIAARAQC